MADEILIKVRADVDGFKADIDEARKEGNKLISDLEKTDVLSKVAENALELKETIKLISKEAKSLGVNLSDVNMDEMVNDTIKLKRYLLELKTSQREFTKGSDGWKLIDGLIKSINIQVANLALETKEVAAANKTVVQQLKEAKKEAQALTQQFGANSTQAQAAAARVSELQEVIEDAADAANANKGNGAFIALTKSVQAASGAVSVLQGTIGLMGVESEDTQKAILKVQSALAITQGLDALEDAGRAFGQLKVVALDAFKSIRTAIGSTGIGLLVVALGTIYAYWDDIKEVVSGVSNEQKKLNESSKADLNNAKEKLKTLNDQDNVLKLQGKTESQIRQLKIEALDLAIQKSKIDLQNTIATVRAQVAAEQRNKEILKGILEFTALPLIALLKGIDKIGAALGKNFGLAEGFKELTTNLIFDPTETAKEGAETIKEATKQLKDLDNTRAGLLLQNKEKEKEASKEVKDQRIKDIKEVANFAKSVYTSTENQISNAEEIEKINDTLLTERDRVMIHYGELLLLAEKNLQDTTAIEQKLFDELAALDKKDLDEKIKKDEQIKSNSDSVGKSIGDAYERGYQTAEEAQQELLDKQRQALEGLLGFAKNGILLSIGLNPQDVERLEGSIKGLLEKIKNNQPIDAGEYAQAAGNAYFAVSNAIAANDAQKRQEELAALEVQQEEELRLAGDNEQKKDVIRQKYALKEREIKQRQAEADKKKAIMDATINTAVAVIKAISQSPLTLGMPWAAIVAALGAAQIAMIAATPIPKFAKGVVSFDGKGGLVKGEGTGTSDSNLAYLSKGESVIPAEPTSANLGLINELVNGDVDSYINRHYVMPALQAKESKASEQYRHSLIEAENNLIARVSSSTLKSIDRRLVETNQSIKGLAKNDSKW